MTETEKNELRVKVAEFAGFTDIVFRKCTADDNGDWYGIPPDPISDDRFHLPDYPNDWNACAGLIDLLADKGWTCTLANGLDKTWECTFETGTSGHKDFRQYYVPADNLATAICQAFVKTMEEKR